MWKLGVAPLKRGLELDSDRGRESSPEIGGSVFGVVGEDPRRDLEDEMDLQGKDAHVAQAQAPIQPEGNQQAASNAIPASSATALQSKPFNEEDLLRQIISKSKAREKTIEELVSSDDASWLVKIADFVQQQTHKTLRVELETVTRSNDTLRLRVAELETLNTGLGALKDKTARLAKEKLKKALQMLVLLAFSRWYLTFSLTRYKRDVDSDWETLEGKFKKHVENHPVISLQDITALRTEISNAREGEFLRLTSDK